MLGTMTAWAPRRTAFQATAIAGAAALLWLVLTFAGARLQSPAGPSTPRTAAPTHGLSALQSLPLAAQASISGTLGAQAHGFAATRASAGWTLRGGGISATLGAGGAHLRAAGASLSLSLAAVGRSGLAGTALAAPTRMSARGNRVTLDRAGIREWYAAGPLGVEQGFTLSHRPAGTAGAVTLAISTGGSVEPQASGSEIRFVTSAGHLALRYGGLTATDASGRHLASRLSVRNGRLVISVNDLGARYPVRIDPLVQQGPKLLPSDPKGDSEFGGSVAISADGNTALIGGPEDQSNGDVNGRGEAWIFTRSGGVWSQQGPRLLPSGRSGNASDFGTSVALSADGNTALIGGDFDDPDQSGAAWVFTRTGSAGAQQSMLTGTGEDAGGHFGASVALSSDGNTALIGATMDSTAGSAFVFTRSGATWSQQGLRLTPSDASGDSTFGEAVALSGDGRTALIGGHFDNSTTGAAWVFTSNGTTWTQRTKIVPGDEDPSPGSFAPPDAAFGDAVDLSTDGTTALIGGDQNAGGEGAAWVYTGSGAAWTEQRKLTPNGVTDDLGAFGSSVALSGDGNAAAVGASNDASGVGAVLVFARSGSTWTDTGSRLNASDETNTGAFGNSVALSSDGQTLLTGARQDNGGHGAAFVFAPPAPVCNSVSATTAIGGGGVAVSLACIFPTGAAPHFNILGGPTHGSVAPFNAGTGQLVYTSQGGFSGQDSFVYMVSDQWGVSNTATATLNVPALPVPSCSNVTVNAPKAAKSVTLTLKCSGPAGHPITFGVVSQPANGKLGAINQTTGKVTYTPKPGFSGSDRFVYRAVNAGGASNAAVATIKLPTLLRLGQNVNFVAVPGPKSTVIDSLTVRGLTSAEKVNLSCKGKGCPIKPRSAKLAKHKVCTGKGKKRKCKSVVPKKADLQLTINKRFKVGQKIIIVLTEPKTIGKRITLTMVKNHVPATDSVPLLPGSTTKVLPGSG
jgi:hypothetical protein